MSGVNLREPQGVLRRGWQAVVDDYAIAGGWSKDGAMLVVADAAGGIHAFDGRSGATVWSRRGAHTGGVMAARVDPTGNLLATAGQDGRLLLWSLPGGQIFRSVELSRAWVEHLAWSAKGTWVAASSGKRVWVFHRQGEEVLALEEHPSTVSALAWSGDEELGTACYGQVRFVAMPGGQERQTLHWKGSLISMVLSPDGTIVACGSQDKSVHFWRRSSGQDSMMSGYPGKPSALAFDRTGTLLATSGGEEVTVWSFQGGGPEGTSPGVLAMHVDPVTALAFAPHEPRLASGARDGAVMVWQVAGDGNGRAVGAAMTSAVIAGLYWRPDGRALAALDSRGSVHVWRTA